MKKLICTDCTRELGICECEQDTNVVEVIDYDRVIHMLRRANEYILDSRGITNSTQLFQNFEVLVTRGIIGEAMSIVRREKQIVEGK
jgi:hypothetical protein